MLSYCRITVHSRNNRVRYVTSIRYDTIRHDIEYTVYASTNKGLTVVFALGSVGDLKGWRTGGGVLWKRQYAPVYQLWDTEIDAEAGFKFGRGISRRSGGRKSWWGWGQRRQKERKCCAIGWKRRFLREKFSILLNTDITITGANIASIGAEGK